MDTRLRQYNQEQKLIEWAKQITERQESGMPIEKWCRERGIDPYKYPLWALREAPKLFETDREWAKKLTPEHCIQH